LSIGFVRHFDTTTGVGLSSFNHTEIRSKIGRCERVWSHKSHQSTETLHMAHF
jgi:hypothetical protein